MSTVHSTHHVSCFSLSLSLTPSPSLSRTWKKRKKSHRGLNPPPPRPWSPGSPSRWTTSCSSSRLWPQGLRCWRTGLPWWRPRQVKKWCFGISVVFWGGGGYTILTPFCRIESPIYRCRALRMGLVRWNRPHHQVPSEGFEPWTSTSRVWHSTNWATQTH